MQSLIIKVEQKDKDEIKHHIKLIANFSDLIQ